MTPPYLHEQRQGMCLAVGHVGHCQKERGAVEAFFGGADEHSASSTQSLLSVLQQPSGTLLASREEVVG